MAVKLTKGTGVDLKKATIQNVYAGLGWDMNEGVEATADLDLFLVQRLEDGTARDSDLIFYGNKKNGNGSVYVGEDNLTGEGDGYDEEAILTLANIPADVMSVIVGVSIYDADAKHQDFGQIKAAFCDILNNDTKEKVAEYDLSSEMKDNTAIIAGEFKRKGEDWEFVAVGEGVKGGMAEIIQRYGIEVA
jgi:tellurium resistance protein TerD